MQNNEQIYEMNRNPLLIYSKSVEDVEWLSMLHALSLLRRRMILHNAAYDFLRTHYNHKNGNHKKSQRGTLKINHNKPVIFRRTYHNHNHSLHWTPRILQRSTHNMQKIEFIIYWKRSFGIQ